MDKKVKLSVVVVAIVIVTLTFYMLYNGSEAEFESTEITVINEQGENITIYVELAMEHSQHRKGLSGRDSLCDPCGMLFIFDENISSGFWMKDTSIPLSIAFIAEDGTILDIQDMEPYTDDEHKPEGEYRYALEVNKAFFQDNDIHVGNMVIIPEEYRT